MKDLLTSEAAQQLESWSPREQAQFAALIEWAKSELQKELLHRAVAARHPPSDVQAFAEAIRDLDDEAAFAACTLADGNQATSSVVATPLTGGRTHTTWSAGYGVAASNASIASSVAGNCGTPSLQCSSIANS